MPVLAYHVILSTHGFWLPNDPRGSYSTEVHADHLKPFGDATTVNTRRSVAPRNHNRPLRRAAKESMERPEVVLTGRQALSAAQGFALAARRSRYAIHACVILPQHAHLVIGRHDYFIEQVVRELRQRATMKLVADQLHPFAPGLEGTSPSIWSQGFWKVFLNSPDDICRTIRYVENNPIRDGKRSQRWSFLTTYEG